MAAIAPQDGPQLRQSDPGEIQLGTDIGELPRHAPRDWRLCHRLLGCALARYARLSELDTSVALCQSTANKGAHKDAADDEDHEEGAAQYAQDEPGCIATAGELKLRRRWRLVRRVDEEPAAFSDVHRLSDARPGSSVAPRGHYTQHVSLNLYLITSSLHNIGCPYLLMHYNSRIHSRISTAHLLAAVELVQIL